ncbi:major facilitator superfamily domain-containing protein 6-B isoform X2 [Procambarus clarkii]|uniref:major facilitator superfamily domain-containing protein 6-B isoform X2 n=1 Tax=Procambarus clarkii TaxID=6728 RepID=UPI003743DD11
MGGSASTVMRAVSLDGVAVRSTMAGDEATGRRSTVKGVQYCVAKVNMKINTAFIPLKAHYFCFLGCVAPILPFLIVVGIQLGIPVSLTGTLAAISLLLVVFMKPVIATLADVFPTHRRLIFLLTLIIMVTCYSCLIFIPPMREVFRVRGHLVRAHNTAFTQQGHTTKPPTSAAELEGSASQPLLLTQDDGGCYVAVAWDCIASCNHPWSCLSSNTSSSGIRLTSLPKDHSLNVYHTAEEASHFHIFGSGSYEGVPLWGRKAADEGTAGIRGRLYQLEGVNVSWDLLMANVSMECKGGQWEGSKCAGVWTYWEFWIFALLLFVGQIAFNTAISITDAIIVDTIGKTGDYGIQRAWGTVGWGLMGPLSGLLIDWWSGSSTTKNYTPAFLLCLFLGSSDIIISSATIKVPEMKTEHDVLKKVWPILRQPRFFIFCCFVLLNGAFDGIVASYIFIMQEDMAKGTDAMSYMKFLQGLTIFVQCSLEAPFMFINNWFMRKLGANYVTSLVFFLYIFRLLGLSIVGAYGPVWATLVVELLNGPCYGLGYTAIVVYSAKISPPGTSTTVQSIVNLFYESIGYAVASFVGGLLYSSLGGPGTYLVAGITATVTFVLHFISLKLLPPPQDTGTEKGLPNGQVEESLEKLALNIDNATENRDEETSVSGKDEESVELQPEDDGNRSTASCKELYSHHSA